jgi:hypothetical protein
LDECLCRSLLFFFSRLMGGHVDAGLDGIEGVIGGV